MSIQMPCVAYVEQFSTFMDFVKDESSRVHAIIWRGIKLEMDLVHFDHCFGDDATREGAARALLEYAEGQLAVWAGADVARYVESRMQQAITHMEVSQASQMEPEDEAAVWEAWDRMDAQSAAQERIDMYRNEY